MSSTFSQFLHYLLSSLNVLTFLTFPFVDASVDSPVLSLDEINVESKSVSTSQAKRCTPQEEFDGVDTHASQVPHEKQKTRCYTGIPAPSTVPQVNPLEPIFPTVVDPVQSQMFAALQALKVYSLFLLELFRLL